MKELDQLLTGYLDEDYAALEVLSTLLGAGKSSRLYRKVLEEMPGTLARAERKSAFYDLGRISEITGDNETAYTCYQNTLRIDPFYRDARERMGSILKGGAQTS